MSNLKQSTFKIGTSKELNCMTEASDQYGFPSHTPMNVNQNQELRNYLKGHHFEFGAKSTHSVKNGQLKTFDGPKGQTRAEKENQELFKNDQRASHFKMGWEMGLNRPTSYNVSKAGGRS